MRNCEIKKKSIKNDNIDAFLKEKVCWKADKGLFNFSAPYGHQSGLKCNLFGNSLKRIQFHFYPIYKL